jgi:hydrogenase expression/formation protein HypD
MLPKEVQLISGPGCPVCVTEDAYIDLALELASKTDVLIATYGDMVRVPGRGGSLERCQPAGKVQVVLSADDVLALARSNPDRIVVFLAVGFETTAPATAVILQEAIESDIQNLCILCGHKLVVPAMKALIDGRNTLIDGFLCPGHVSVIIGSNAFRQIVDVYQRPCVVAGFEPLQIMAGLAEICTMLAEGRAGLGSVYRAAVTPDGNIHAQQLMARYLQVVPARWRGLGLIPQSGLAIRAEFGRFDAVQRFGLAWPDHRESPGCRCGEVLSGLIWPDQCPLFGDPCTPQSPIGPCMVSSEGSCAALYKYGRHVR